MNEPKKNYANFDAIICFISDNFFLEKQRRLFVVFVDVAAEHRFSWDDLSVFHFDYLFACKHHFFVTDPIDWSVGRSVFWMVTIATIVMAFMAFHCKSSQFFFWCGFLASFPCFLSSHRQNSRDVSKRKTEEKLANSRECQKYFSS